MQNGEFETEGQMIAPVIEEARRLGAVRITGVKIAYYFVCKTKLWLFSHNIQMERESEDVAMGKMLHEERYRTERKDTVIGGLISLDFVKYGDRLEVHDIKKSRKMELSHRWQVLYYLYYLYNHGIDAVGIINYPLLNKKEVVEAKEDDFLKIGEVLKDIENIVLGDMPKPMRIKICPKCSYYEFCWG